MKGFIGFIGAIIIVCALWFGLTMFGFFSHKVGAEVEYKHDTITENTSYDNRKMVEDTARSSIVNYNTYLSEYQTYSEFCEDSKYDDGKCTRSMNAKTSVNRVANQYNEYIQKNGFVFEGNLPSDIPQSLATV